MQISIALHCSALHCKWQHSIASSLANVTQLWIITTVGRLGNNNTYCFLLWYVSLFMSLSPTGHRVHVFGLFQGEWSGSVTPAPRSVCVCVCDVCVCLCVFPPASLLNPPLCGLWFHSHVTERRWVQTPPRPGRELEGGLQRGVVSQLGWAPTPLKSP